MDSRRHNSPGSGQKYPPADSLICNLIAGAGEGVVISPFLVHFFFSSACSSSCQGQGGRVMTEGGACSSVNHKRGKG